MLAVCGPEVKWSDTDYLSAMIVDTLAQLAWMFARANFKDAPKKPPSPVRRPGDIATRDGETGSVNLSERGVIIGGSLTPEELDELIEAQTGAVKGIAQEV